jgi:hypothetical protein
MSRCSEHSYTILTINPSAKMGKIRISGCVNVAQVRRQMQSKAKKSGLGEVNKITSILRVQAHKGDTKAWVSVGILPGETGQFE